MKINTLFGWEKLAATLAATVALSLSTAANAATLGPAADYNVFVLEDFNQQRTDIEGKLAAGGNLTFTGGFSVGSKLSPNSGNVLVAGEDLFLRNGQINNGNAVYGGTANVSGVGIPGGTLSKRSPIDFAVVGEELRGLSAVLSSITANGNTNVAPWGGITLTGTDPVRNVFNLTASALASATGFNINAPEDATVVVNISGTSGTLSNFGFNITGTDKQKVVYNFFEATSLSASSIGIEGSILAPLADFQFNNGQINGQLIAKSLTGTGESHNVLFNGDLPEELDSQISKVPEPATLAGLGLVAAVGILARRQHNKAA